MEVWIHFSQDFHFPYLYPVIHLSIQNMKHLLYLLLTASSILFSSCGTSPNNNNQKYPSVPDLQPEVVSPKAVIGYLAIDDWEFENLFPSIEWKYLTHINASFAKVKADGSLNLDPVRQRIQKVRDVARQHKVKILISIAKNKKGDFTTAIKDPKARKELINNIIAFTREYELDGFDIDYEEYDNWDVNFPSLLVFAKGLHDAKDKNMLMTCAVNSRWLNYGTEWAQYFDYINLMSYDRGAFTDTPTQHASYEDFVKDLEYWNVQCKAPKSKIIGGLPFYGYSWDEELKDVVDNVRGIRYSGILKHLGREAADKDKIGETYYNGRSTIARKCKYINEHDYAGVMIWQLFQDAHNDNHDLKLINVVGEEMKP